MSISYSGILLDETSRSNLIGMLGDVLPQDWEVIAHHMTITMGPLVHPKGKHDFSNVYELGSKVRMPVLQVGMDERAMAVIVQPPGGISRKIKFPHITVAVNRSGGGKPFHSNKIPLENFKDISHLNIILSGEVFEQPNK